MKKRTDIKNVTNYDPKALETLMLREDWRLITAWYASILKGDDFKYSKEQVIGLARLIVKELQSRGTTFHPESMKESSKELYDIALKEKAADKETPGIYLSEAMVKLIADGKKTAFVDVWEFPKMINRDLFLCSDNLCYGMIQLKEPRSISLNSFKILRPFHRISDKERKKRWLDATKLYFYEIIAVDAWKRPRRIITPPPIGSAEFIESVGFEKAWPYEVCECCGQPNKIGFDVSDEDWKAIVPEEYRNNVLCYACFEEFAFKKKHGFELVGMHPVSRTDAAIIVKPTQPHGEHFCTCPKCDYTVKVKTGQKCNEMECPYCGTRLRGSGLGERKENGIKDPPKKKADSVQIWIPKPSGVAE